MCFASRRPRTNWEGYEHSIDHYTHWHAPCTIHDSEVEDMISEHVAERALEEEDLEIQVIQLW